MPELKSNSREGAIEKEISQTIEDIIKKQQGEVSDKDIKKIIDGILPELDKLVSKRIKYHFQLLMEYSLQKIMEE